MGQTKPSSIIEPQYEKRRPRDMASGALSLVGLLIPEDTAQMLSRAF
jgi:hypothetical protein